MYLQLTIKIQRLTYTYLTTHEHTSTSPHSQTPMVVGEIHTKIKTHHMASFLQPPLQDFATKTVCLTQGYVIVLPKKKLKEHNPNNNHQILHPSTSNILIEAYHITQSYYSSPLTCPTQLTQYNSPHNHGMIFGSSRLAKSLKWMGVGIMHPQDHKSTIEAIHWVKMATKKTLPPQP